MTAGTESDQIFVYILSQAATRRDVMNLELAEAPTVLAAPTIPF